MATWSNVLLGVCDAPCSDLQLSPYENKIGGYPVSFNSLLVITVNYTGLAEFDDVVIGMKKNIIYCLVGDVGFLPNFLPLLPASLCWLQWPSAAAGAGLLSPGRF